jgi:tetratricopeptide (TPR) repeat protein
MAEDSPNPDCFSQIEKIINYVKRTPGSGFLFYSCDTSIGIVQINRAIIERARTRGITIVEFFLSMDDTDAENFLFRTRKIAENKPDGIIIANIDELIAYSEDRIIKSINNARDILLEFNIVFLLGMSQENISKFANLAQDLFLRRDRGVVRFVGVPIIPDIEESFAALKTREDLKPALSRELKLKIELLESQLKNAEAQNYDASQIANDIALELVQLYLKAFLIEKAQSLFSKYKFYFNLEDHLKGIEGAANFYYGTAQWDKALELYLKSKKIRRDMGDKEGLSTVLADLGRVYVNKNNLIEAIACFTESRKLLEKLGNKEKLAYILSSLGGLEFKRGQWDKAIDYFSKSLDIFERLEDSANQNIVQENIKRVKERLKEREEVFRYNEALTRYIVKIEDKGTEAKGTFHVEVIFPSGNRYNGVVHDPFKEPGDIELDQEERLRWYFEDHIASPLTDRSKAQRAEKSIAAYGESLFNDLFKGDALLEWDNIVKGLRPVRIQVFSDNPAFQALHWEALKDPRESRAACLEGVEFIRQLGGETPKLLVRKSASLNLLIITARPGGKEDIEYRIIQRQIVETVEKNRLPVNIHILHPPTLRSLKEHLRERKGFYHIVHFDTHGTVCTSQACKAIMQVYEKKRGGGVSFSGKRRNIIPFVGTRPFLALEAEKGGIDLVSEIEIAELLVDANVPVCFLTTEQSSMPTAISSRDTPNRETSTWGASLAMTLVKKGLRLVMGMRWAMTAAASQVMTSTLYDSLTRGENPVTALNRARIALYDSPVRFQYTGILLELQDWLIPVTWGTADFSFNLELDKREEIMIRLHRERMRSRELEGMKMVGMYGFMGRDIDILTIERMLSKRNILLLRGAGGVGKTTLLGHMADWWMKTGWIEHVFYFDYDRKPYYAEEILNTIAETLMPKGDYRTFLVTPDVETKAMLLADFLEQGKETPQVLLVLDNVESFTGSEQAVGSKLEKEEQEKLIKAVKCLLPSSIKILLGSRADETWLGEHTFKDSLYVLEGLDRESRFLLAGQILKDTPIDDRVEFNRLMEILAGYPLAMEIILPNLKDRGAKELREALSGEGVDFKGEKASDEISKYMNISFSLLSPAAQKSVLVFAPFTSFLNGMILEEYLKNLQTPGVLGHLTKADLEDAIQQGEKQGLLKEVSPKCYSIQPVFPFFLGQRKESVFNETEKAVLDQAFCSYMTVLAKMYTALMQSKEPGEKQMGFMLFKWDRENLYKALQRVLDDEGDFFTLYFIFAQFYHQQPLYHEAISFMEGVVKKLDRFSKKEKEFLIQYASVVGNLGTNYQQVRNFSEAKKNQYKALELLQQAGKRQETGAVYHQLGWVAQDERDFAEAKRNYREALKIYREFNDRFSQAGTYHQLGMVAQDERDFAEAKRNYREALKIYQEFNDRFSQAGTYHQLGWVAQDERDFAEAKRNYWEALKIYQEFNDHYSQASTYHQLGILAADERDFAEAKRNYSEALKIYQEFNDRYSQASTYHQLGMVAWMERDFEEAKRCFRETLRITQEFNDRYSQARTYHQLGCVADEEKDYASSLGYYANALEIFLDYNDRYNLEKTKRNLAFLMQIKDWDTPAAIAQLEIKEETKKALQSLLEHVEKEK